MVEHGISLDDGSIIEMEVDSNDYNLDFGISINSGSSSGGNYNMLRNKPSIEGIILQGDSLLTDFGTNNIYFNSTEGWNNQRDLIGKQGAIYIYSDHNQIIKDERTINVPGIKIGDGLAYLIDAPFLDNAISQSMIDILTSETIDKLEQANKLVSVADRIRWDSKVTATISSQIDPENLILFN